MRGLIPDAAALFRAGRKGFRPSASDRDRVRESLALALGESAMLGGAHPAAGTKTTAAAKLWFRSALLGGLPAVALGVGVFVAAHRAPSKPSHVQPLPVISASPIAAAPAPTIFTSDPPRETSSSATGSNQAEPRVDRAPKAWPPSVAQSAARHAADSLPEEVRLLSRAQKELNDGLAEDALKTLGEHERRFAGGALAEERLAARIQALCILGRSAEARIDLTKLARAYPRSPHVGRAKRFCGLDVGSDP